MGAKGAKRQFYVSFSEIDGYWAQKTGGEVTSASNRVYDGGEERPSLLTAPPVPGNITLTRPYEPIRDSAEAARLKPLVGKLSGTLTIQPTDGDLNTVGTPETYPEATLVGCTTPESDAGSGDPSMLVLEFATTLFT